MQSIKRLKLFVTTLGMLLAGVTAWGLPASAAAVYVSYSYPAVRSGVASSTACVENVVSVKSNYYVRLRRIGADGSVSYGPGDYTYFGQCATLILSGMKSGDKIQGYNPISGYYYTLRQI